MEIHYFQKKQKQKTTWYELLAYFNLSSMKKWTFETLMCNLD